MLLIYLVYYSSLGAHLSPYYISYCTSGYCRFFFFFQAEDGIRDVAVTGVQTCALPIYDIVPTLTEYIRIPAKSPMFDAHWAEHGHLERAVGLITDWARRRKIEGLAKIGRASCRERV